MRNAFGERTPVGIQPRIAHFQETADVGGLVAVEKPIALRSIRVFTVATFEEVQRDQRVEKVVDAALVKAKPLPDRFGGERSPGEFRKQTEFDRAQQRLGRPEAEAGLEDVICRRRRFSDGNVRVRRVCRVVNDSGWLREGQGGFIVLRVVTIGVKFLKQFKQGTLLENQRLAIRSERSWHVVGDRRKTAEVGIDGFQVFITQGRRCCARASAEEFRDRDPCVCRCASALRNMSSVQMPRPVFVSGVKLTA